MAGTSPRPETPASPRKSPQDLDDEARRHIRRGTRTLRPPLPAYFAEPALRQSPSCGPLHPQQPRGAKPKYPTPFELPSVPSSPPTPQPQRPPKHVRFVSDPTLSVSDRRQQNFAPITRPNDLSPKTGLPPDVKPISDDPYIQALHRKLFVAQLQPHELEIIEPLIHARRRQAEESLDRSLKILKGNLRGQKARAVEEPRRFEERDPDDPLSRLRRNQKTLLQAKEATARRRIRELVESEDDRRLREDQDRREDLLKLRISHIESTPSALAQNMASTTASNTGMGSDGTERVALNVKKYAGLPDLDVGSEIFEVGGGPPTMTEGSTLDTVSEEGDDDERFDRTRLDAQTARARFEPMHVDARDVNFGSTVDRDRRGGYITSRRRRRRRRPRDEDGSEEYSDTSDDDESLPARLARLKREAEEVKAEIDRMEKQNGDDENEFKDSVEQQIHDEAMDMANTAQDLNNILDSLTVTTQPPKGDSFDTDFLRKFNTDPTKPSSSQPVPSLAPPLPQSTISAISAFSDRLSTLETLLGLSQLDSPSAPPAAILPTLDNLNTQISTLHATLTPSTDPTAPPFAATTHLDPLSTRLRELIEDSKRLEDSRRAAQKSFDELLETRERNANLFHGTTPTDASDPRALMRRTSTQQQSSNAKDQALMHPLTLHALPPNTSPNMLATLHSVLPRLQALEPLLPLTLERLRSLHALHAGAATARAEIDEFEARLSRNEAEVAKWREALEGVEGGMGEVRNVVGENLGVLRNVVERLEERVGEVRRKMD